MAKHRSRISVREDFTKHWSLKLWSNPNKKFQVVKCEICNPRKRIGNKKDGRIIELED